MENAHLQGGFSEIAQNLTTFPDGSVAVCRRIDTIPAGVKRANRNGICIENLGNFDAGQDTLTSKQQVPILSVFGNRLCFITELASVRSEVRRRTIPKGQIPRKGRTRLLKTALTE